MICQPQLHTCSLKWKRVFQAAKDRCEDRLPLIVTRMTLNDKRLSTTSLTNAQTSPTSPSSVPFAPLLNPIPLCSSLRSPPPPSAPHPTDHFDVLERWVVRSLPQQNKDGQLAPVVSLQVLVEVKFSKFTMLKRLILSTAQKVRRMIGVKVGIKLMMSRRARWRSGEKGAGAARSQGKR